MKLFPLIHTNLSIMAATMITINAISQPTTAPTILEVLKYAATIKKVLFAALAQILSVPST